MPRSPEAVDFALHKLLIAGRRKDKEKAKKDRAQAIALLIALNASGETENIRKVFYAMPKTWRSTISRELLALGEKQLMELIEGS